jgi:hypothetical protein
MATGSDNYDQMMDYEFWLWEYQSRNKAYQAAYDEVVSSAIEDPIVPFWIIVQHEYSHRWLLTLDYTLADEIIMPNPKDYCEENPDFVFIDTKEKLDKVHNLSVVLREPIYMRVTGSSLKKALIDRADKYPEIFFKSHLKLFESSEVEFFPPEVLKSFREKFFRYPKPYSARHDSEALLRTLIEDDIDYDLNGLSVLTLPSYYKNNPVMSMVDDTDILVNIWPEFDQAQKSVFTYLEHLILRLWKYDGEMFHNLFDPNYVMRDMTVKDYREKKAEMSNFNDKIALLAQNMVRVRKLIRSNKTKMHNVKYHQRRNVSRVLGLLMFDEIERTQCTRTEACRMVNNLFGKINRSYSNHERREGSKRKEIIDEIKKVVGVQSRMNTLLNMTIKSVENMDVFGIDEK